MTLINFKGSDELKRALQTVAFIDGHLNISKIIVDTLQRDPAIAREMKKLRKTGKNAQTLQK